MKVEKTELPGLLIIEPVVHGDARGFFMEAYARDRYEAAGTPRDFVQDNLSFSARGVLRGLHLQHPHGQGKLCMVLQGEVFDVAVDLRVGSPTFGQWKATTLSSDNKRQFYIPPGFAHGFCVVSETALFSYKCTERYAPESEVGIAWNDPDIGVAWPIEQPTLSGKDQQAPRLSEVAQERLPRFEP